jgi:hypothetical protein
VKLEAAKEVVIASGSFAHVVRPYIGWVEL